MSIPLDFDKSLILNIIKKKKNHLSVDKNLKTQVHHLILVAPKTWTTLIVSQGRVGSTLSPQGLLFFFPHLGLFIFLIYHLGFSQFFYMLLVLLDPVCIWRLYVHVFAFVLWLKFESLCCFGDLQGVSASFSWFFWFTLGIFRNPFLLSAFNLHIWYFIWLFFYSWFEIWVLSWFGNCLSLLEDLLDS